MNRLARYFMPALKPLLNERGEVATTIFDALTEDARKAIPEEYTKDPNITKYKDIGEFFKGHRHLVETVGKKGVIVPGEKATPEELDAFYKGIGRPDKPEGYKFTIAADKLHPAIKITPEATSRLAGMLHKRGVPQSIADGLIQDYLGDLSANLSALDQANEEKVKTARAALEKEWGAGKIEENLKSVSLFIERVGGKDAVKDLGDLGANPTALRLLHKIQSALSEDSINRIISGGKAPESAEREQARAKIDAVLKDTTHPYWNENDPKHDEAVKDMTRLYEIAEAEL